MHLPWASRTWWFRQRAGFLVAGTEDRWTFTLKMGELWPLGGVYSMFSRKVGGVIKAVGAAAAILGISLDRAWSGWCKGFVRPPIGVSTIIRLFSLDLGFVIPLAAMSANRFKLVFSCVASVVGATVDTVLSGRVADVVLVVVVLLVPVVSLIGLTVNALSS